MSDVDSHYVADWLEWTLDPAGDLRAELGDDYDPTDFDPEEATFNAAEKAVADAEDRLWDLASGQAAHRRWFEETLWGEWGAGLEYMEGALVFAAFVAWYLDTRVKARRGAAHDVLIGLNARGVRVGHEVFALLRSGYADGAHARWRTLYEIAVVATLVARFGDETAKRYKDFGIIELAREFEDALTGRMSPQERRSLEELHQKRTDLVDEYGPAYGKEYGWAAHLFDPPLRRVTFAQLKRLAEIDTHGRHMQRAHAHVHASSLAAALNSVDEDTRRVFTWGPVSADLGTPAYLVGCSLDVLSSAVINGWAPVDEDDERLACLAAAAHEVYLSFGLAFTRVNRDSPWSQPATQPSNRPPRRCSHNET